MTPRGSLIVGTSEDEEVLRARFLAMQALVPNVQWWSQAEMLQQVPVLRPEFAAFGIYEPDAMDMDVHGIHQGFLRGAKRRAPSWCVMPRYRRSRATRVAGVWENACGRLLGAVLVNAAGAWCDEVAQRAGVATVGLQPKRRTAFTCETPAGMDTSAWPMVIDLQETYYLKPDAGLLLVSPANEDPVNPQDVQPEELDVAIAVDRVETVTTLQIRKIKRAWAGLRSFVADKTPVVGFAPDAPGFFWLAGQGGYGIQTAPAMGELAAALVQGLPVPDALAALGVRAEDVSPLRPGLGATP